MHLLSHSFAFEAHKILYPLIHLYIFLNIIVISIRILFYSLFFVIMTHLVTMTVAYSLLLFLFIQNIIKQVTRFDGKSKSSVF